MHRRVHRKITSKFGSYSDKLSTLRQRLDMQTDLCDALFDMDTPQAATELEEAFAKYKAIEAESIRMGRLYRWSMP